MTKVKMVGNEHALLNIHIILTGMGKRKTLILSNIHYGTISCATLKAP